MTTELIISFELDGQHAWHDAPKQYEEFSRPHRHLFKFICWYPQGNSNDPTRRETELWELRMAAIDCIHESYMHLGNGAIDFQDSSCEGIAQTLKARMKFSKVMVCEEWFLGAIVS